jgi:hypothetical protein
LPEALPSQPTAQIPIPGQGEYPQPPLASLTTHTCNTGRQYSELATPICNDVHLGCRHVIPGIRVDPLSRTSRKPVSVSSRPRFPRGIIIYMAWIPLPDTVSFTHPLVYEKMVLIKILPRMSFATWTHPKVGAVKSLHQGSHDESQETASLAYTRTQKFGRVRTNLLPSWKC